MVVASGIVLPEPHDGLLPTNISEKQAVSDFVGSWLLLPEPMKLPLHPWLWRHNRFQHSHDSLYVSKRNLKHNFLGEDQTLLLLFSEQLRYGLAHNHVEVPFGRFTPPQQRA